MLNPDLNWPAIQSRYARNNFVVISDLFDENSAEAIYQSLIHDVEWKTCFSGKRGPEDYTTAELNGMSPEEKQQINTYIQNRASRHFSFMYQRADLTSSEIPILRDLYQYISSSKFLGFIRYITGALEINMADGQASRYQRTAFLNIHDDNIEVESRIAAYVISFTKGWRADYGGLLHMMDDDHTIKEVIIPRFNRMTIFRIPRKHFVSQVANYTPIARYTVNGWFTKV